MANTPISCIVLAGGKSSRMNGIDKGLLVYKGRYLVEHAIAAVSSQVDDIIISANRNIEEYAGFGHRVITDNNRRFDGPLAGIISAAPYSRHDWIFIIPCDMPLLPASLVATLAQHTEDSKLVVISNDNHLQLVFLMHRSLQESIKLYLSMGGHAVMRWLDSVDHRTVALDHVDYFYNINTPDQI